MNKSAIKNYAVWARQQLLLAVRQRAFALEIYSDGRMVPDTNIVDGRALSAIEKDLRNTLIQYIRNKGYEAVMEEAAYTWFNRFIALRFMEVNGFLPSKVRVFTDESGNFKPEILKQSLTVELENLDRNQVLDYLNKQDQEELYRYLLITQCNDLNKALPGMFETLSGWEELLFPDYLLRPESVIDRMIRDIPEEDWTDQVQIIGWLYQYYNSELKDIVDESLMKKQEISSELIPVVTQLYTPDWIVRYLVENSLGRLAINGKLSNVREHLSEAERIVKEKEIAEGFGWKYYIPEAEQALEKQDQLNKLQTPHFTLHALTFIDPCMGSGHVLVYAFDVLMQLYQAEGWSDQDAVKSILENNLYGLDIDTRAGQLAYFSVMMKGRKYFRKLFSANVVPHIFSLKNADFIDDELIQYVCSNNTKLQDILKTIRQECCDSELFGSLLPCDIPDISLLKDRINEILSNIPTNLLSIEKYNIVKDKLLPLIWQCEMLSNSFDVVCTNPPYMGIKKMPEAIREFLADRYPFGKHDTATAFIERCMDFCHPNGIVSMVTMDSWMHLSSYKDLRKELVSTKCFISISPVDSGEFEGVETVMAVIRNGYQENFRTNIQRHLTYSEWNPPHQISLSKITYLPNEQISCNVTENILNAFAMYPMLSNSCEMTTGLQTGDNERFCRFWYEVSSKNLKKNAQNVETALKSGRRWFPINKGGGFRKWYGLRMEVVDWKNNGKALTEFKNAGGSVIIAGRDRYFQSGIDWNLNTFGHLSLRYSPPGAIVGNGGPMCFSDEKNLPFLLGFLNSSVAACMTEIINPSRNCPPGSLGSLPWQFDSQDKNTGKITLLAEDCIQISRNDWNSFETSSDFKSHPLI